MFPNSGRVLVLFLLAALTCKPVPGVWKRMPRARGAVAALKKSGGYGLGADFSSGTASQLISRRPSGLAPGPPALSAPSRPRYWSTTAAISPAPVTTTGCVPDGAAVTPAAAAAAAAAGGDARVPGGPLRVAGR